MNAAVEQILMVHVMVAGIFLAGVAILLIRRGLFHWTSSGFWAWSAFTLYFVLNPWAATVVQDVDRFAQALAISGGEAHAYWILFVALLGMTAFFWSYLQTRPRRVTWRIWSDDVTPMMNYAIVILSLVALFSLLTRRAFVINPGRTVIFEGGQHMGQVTGYESLAYKFVMVPLLMAIFSRNRNLRRFAWAVAGLWLFMSLPHGWGRQSLVTMLVAFSLADTVNRRKVWPRGWMIACVVLFGVILQMRGHASWTLDTGAKEIAAHSQKIAEDPTGVMLNAVSSGDARPLATWYVESYGADQVWGYSYGIPIVNYMLLGWIPSRVFPQKYFMVNWLKARQAAVTDEEIVQFMHGQKATLLGDFYLNGGWLGVCLLAWIAGFLSRRLDGMLRVDVPLLVRATGAGIMSGLWMVWQSSVPWGLIAMSVNVIPALILWFFAQKAPKAPSAWSASGMPRVPPRGSPGPIASSPHRTTMARRVTEPWGSAGTVHRRVT